jgi:hypothetical protein
MRVAVPVDSAGQANGAAGQGQGASEGRRRPKFWRRAVVDMTMAAVYKVRGNGNTEI